MNRGDIETLLCAILCAVHIVMMGAFTRRTDAWLLAGSQVIVCGVMSVVVTALLPAPYGFQNLAQRLCAGSGARPGDLPGAVLHGVRVLGTGAGADSAWSRRGRGALLHRAGDGCDPQRLLAEGADDGTAGRWAAR